MKEHIHHLIISTILVLINFSCQGQEEISEEVKNRSYYIIIANYSESDSYKTGTLITSYCKNLKELPKSPLALIEYCLSDWHPNDIIIDDFDTEELRIIEFKEQMVLYYIGPDGVDDKCLQVIDRIDGIGFDQYLNLKGDIILGSVDLDDLKFYMKGKVD